MSIDKAWNSEAFQIFRGKFFDRCQDHQCFNQCLGGCPVLPEITICPKLLDEKVMV
jgi:hypothetical protein